MSGDDPTLATSPRTAGRSDLERLLATKLLVPPARAHALARPELVRVLESARPAALTLVSAPAGFGKTALLTEWSVRHRAPVAWLSLDPEDDDPVRFWTYLVHALDHRLAGVAEVSLASLRGPSLPPMQAVLTPLVNALTTRGEPITLILDDYHLIENDAIHETLTWLLEQLPATFHFVIASRTEPPLPLARFRARGQLVELRTPELRFTLDEVNAFLNDTMGLGLAPSETGQLADRTEGWITGLQLAALSLAGHDDPASFVRALTGSQRHIFDYLIEEVLDRQPPRIARFLLDTCVLEALCGPLCDAVTARDDGQAMLAAIDSANLFLFPLDGERRWYRYHQLFAEALRARAQDRDPAGLRERHRRASRWCEANGFGADATRHALEAGDTGRAAALVAEQAPALIRRGESVTLQRWLEAVPEDTVVADPKLCVHYAWALFFQGRTDESDGWLARARAHAPEDALVRGEILAMAAFLSVLRMDQEVSAELGRAALELLPDEHPLLDLVAMTLAMEHVYGGQPAAAAEAFGRAAQLARRRGNRFALVCSLGQVGDGLMQQGELHRAAEAYREAERAARLPGGEALPIVGLALVGLGEVMREWNRLDEAERLLTRGITLCREAGDLAAYDGLFSLARVQHARARDSDALATLGDVARLIAGLEAPDLPQLVALHETRFGLVRGQRDDAVRWKRSAERVVDGLLVPVAELVQLTLARVELAQRDAGAALRRLERLREPALQDGRVTGLLQILALQALALAALGHEARARATLGAALARAEPAGFVRLFVDEGPALHALLSSLRTEHAGAPGVAEGWSMAYLDTLIAAFDPAVSASQDALRAIEPLSDRERAVLRHIALGATNKQIAKELGIAPSTVKWYVSGIFAKLQVERRTQAVSRAREYGII